LTSRACCRVELAKAEEDEKGGGGGQKEVRPEARGRGLLNAP